MGIRALFLQGRAPPAPRSCPHPQARFWEGAGPGLLKHRFSDFRILPSILSPFFRDSGLWGPQPQGFAVSADQVRTGFCFLVDLRFCVLLETLSSGTFALEGIKIPNSRQPLGASDAVLSGSLHEHSEE